MWLQNSWICLLLLALSLSLIEKAEACTCVRSHPQTRFCMADFVAVVKVKKVIPPVNGSMYEMKAYKVKINRIFKADEASDIALRQNLLWTAPASPMCGAYLNVGETYVVSGQAMAHSNKAVINSCGLAIRWSDVTNKQRKGFRKLYEHGCVCDIRYTLWHRKGADLASAGGKRCLWESTPGPQDCQENYGVCLSGIGGCSWLPSVPYKNCIKKYQREREQQRTREP